MLLKSLFRQFTTHNCDKEQKIYGGVICLAIWLFVIYFIFGNWFLNSSNDRIDRISLELTDVEKIVLDNDAELARGHNDNCSYWDCFDVYRCGERLTIYVYPLVNYMDANDVNEEHGTMRYLSREFFEILKIISESPFYTADPKEACVFVPSIDTLNLNRAKEGLVAKALASLP